MNNTATRTAATVYFAFTPSWEAELDGTGVTAVFIATMDSNRAFYFYDAYCHEGQHTSASGPWIAQQDAATPDQYAALMGELAAVGYDVTPVSEAYFDGYRMGRTQATAAGEWRSNGAVSIPSRWLGSKGELPTAADGWTVAAHEYGDGYRAGWESIHPAPEPATPDTLNEAMGFDTVVRVLESGAVVDAPGVIFPDYVFQNVDSDGQTIDNEVHGLERGWTAVTGFSGQHGYSGPVMHASEYVGGGLARHILANPGYYVVTTVAADTDGDDNVNTDDPVGWIVLHRMTYLP